MSLLSSYLQSLREMRSLTDQNLAQYSKMDLESYQKLERNPEKVPLYRLVPIFNAIELEKNEFLAISAVAADLVR